MTRSFLARATIAFLAPFFCLILQYQEERYVFCFVDNEFKFESIAEVPVEVHLFNLRIGGGVGRQGRIDSLVRVKAVIKVQGFCVDFKLADDAVSEWGVFGNLGFNAGGIKDRHLHRGRVDSLADKLGKINEPFKKVLDIIKEIVKISF